MSAASRVLSLTARIGSMQRATMSLTQISRPLSSLASRNLDGRKVATQSVQPPWMMQTRGISTFNTNSGSVRSLLKTFATMLSRPTGWEHFPSPKKDGSETKSGDQQTASGNQKSGGNGGGSGGGPKDDKNYQNMMNNWNKMNQYNGWLSLAIFIAFVMTMFLADSSPEMTWQEFLNLYLAKGMVDKLEVVNKEMVKVYVKSSSGHPSRAVGFFRIGSIEVFEERMEEAQRILGKSSTEMLPILYHNETSFLEEVFRFVPTLAVIGLTLMLLRGTAGGIGGKGGKGIFSVGKSNAKKFVKESSSITFNDVAGLPEAKVEVEEFVQFLKNPKKYQELGAKIPKGALLVGPPGTGKTLLAKATAGEANVPFFSTSGSDFIEMFVGVGPSRVRDLFSNARESAPCIVFIDEIDAIGRARGKGGFSGGNDERENTLNQLLVEMDGFSTNTGVVVLAGTNRPDVLDKALLRPGRFDRQISIDNPDLKSREEIFLVHLKPIKLAQPREQYAPQLAALTPGFSGADIANVCNEAALIAARSDVEVVDVNHFEAAIDRVIGGLEKKNHVMSPAEKKTVAFHEAGHAVVSWFLEHASPLLKVSIVPRGSAALGYAQYTPKDQYLHTKEQMLDTMCMAMGGRVAEMLMLNTISTGAQDDLEKVTRMAYSQVMIYGMNEKIGPLSYPRRDGESHMTRQYSEETAQFMDEEVRSIISNAFERTKKILGEHLEGLRNIATLLLEKEVIRKDDIESILGPRPFAPSTMPSEKTPITGEHPATPPPPTELPA